MTDVIDISAARRKRDGRQSIDVGQVRDHVLMPIPGGKFAWVPRSSLSLRELAHIDFLKSEHDL